ncbi:hypothetical protein ACFL39_00155 [Gemmatimonadota bacterium]
MILSERDMKNLLQVRSPSSVHQRYEDAGSGSKNFIRLLQVRSSLTLVADYRRNLVFELFVLNTMKARSGSSAYHYLRSLLILVLVCTPLTACDRNPADSDDYYSHPAGQWDFDTSGFYAYRHDGRPFRGEHFTVYSDGSSQSAKETLADIAEEIFTELVPEFLVVDIEEELGFTGDYTYYIYAAKHLDEILAMGYRNGFFMDAIDCVTVRSNYHTNPTAHRYIMKHEMTHVFQFTFTDCARNNDCPGWLGVWFREGQAIQMGGNYRGQSIDTLPEFEAWRANQNHSNPILIHRWTDFPDPDRGGEYYPMFGLAYAYLVDEENGFGASVSDMREMFRQMAAGLNFYAAFEVALGMSVADYAADFYDLMEEYLSTQNHD